MYYRKPRIGESHDRHDRIIPGIVRPAESADTSEGDGVVAATVPRYASDEDVLKIVRAMKGTGIPVYFE